ncbi:MAG TPA: hypothetical protein VN937_24285 [Blastocatellia bacterium]|nr:hypothetical protein [Blastocatellia bacterium]
MDYQGDDRFNAFLGLLTRIDRFGRTYVNYFVRTSFAGQQFAIVRASVDEIDRLRRKRRPIGLTTWPQILSRAVLKEILIREMNYIDMTAQAIAMHRQIPDDKFRTPWTRDDAKILLAARVFAEDAIPLRDEFLKYCMRETFIDELRALADEFEEAIAARRQVTGARPCVEALIDDAMERGLLTARRLDVMMLNRFYDDNLGRNEWFMTSHVSYRTGSNAAPGGND